MKKLTRLFFSVIKGDRTVYEGFKEDCTRKLKEFENKDDYDIIQKEVKETGLNVECSQCGWSGDSGELITMYAVEKVACPICRSWRGLLFD